MRKVWVLLKAMVTDFMADDCLSRGAAIAYYTIFSIAPVLIIVIAIAGLAFGREAAQGAIFGQLQGLMGDQAAGVIQTMLKGADNKTAGIWATAIGVGTLIVTASGVFSEMQTSLNLIWKAEPNLGTVTRMVRARLASLGLVMTLGFLLLVSLVVSAALKALSDYVNDVFPGAHILFQALSFLVSFLLIAMLFAAIYKVLPDKRIAWRDVFAGALATSFLFTLGKFAISLYIGSSSMATTYGAAGSLLIVLLWIYYSAQIFLLGAEFTKVYAETHGSHAAAAANQLGAEGRVDLDTAAAPARDPLGHPELADLKNRLSKVSTNTAGTGS
jgi:membrane protein